MSDRLNSLIIKYPISSDELTKIEISADWIADSLKRAQTIEAACQCIALGYRVDHIAHAVKRGARTVEHISRFIRSGHWYYA